MADDERAWAFSLRFFTGYNDNVPLVPDKTTFSDEGDRSSLYGGLTATGEYRLLSGPEWAAGVNFRFDQLGYTDRKAAVPAAAASDPNDYDLTAVAAGGQVRRFFKAGDRPASLGVSYSFRRDWLADIGAEDGWSRVHTVALDLALDLSESMRISTEYRLAFEDFDDDRNQPQLDSRDGLRQSLGLTGAYFFDQKRRAVILGYRYMENDTDGSNFRVQSSHSVRGRFQSLVAGPVWAGVSAGFTRENYDGFVTGFTPPPGRTRQDIRKYGAQLLWLVSARLSLDLYYIYEDYAANQPEFEADRANVGAGLTVKF